MRYSFCSKMNLESLYCHINCSIFVIIKNRSMNYCSLLQEDQWKAKCMLILEREHFTCQDCHKKGIHSTFFPIKAIEEIETLFPNTLFNGNRLSDCLRISKWNGSIKTSIRASSKYVEDNLFFSNFDDGGIGNTYNIISNNNISEVHYKIFRDNILLSNNGKTTNGRITAFYFEENITKSNYVSIKHHLGENTPLYETLEISILHNNVLYDLYFSLLNSDNTPMFNFTQLHIHHTYYVKDKNPWEYENDALITLCADCHQKRHRTTMIPMYDNRKELLKSNLPLCDRCQGRGYIPQFHYHYEGICFECYGEGVCFHNE